MDPSNSETHPQFRLLFPRYKSSKKNRTAGVSAILLASSPHPFALSELSIGIDTLRIAPHFSKQDQTGKSSHHICRISFSLPYEEAKRLPINTKVLAWIPGNDGLLCSPIAYNSLIPLYIAAHGPYLNDDENKMVAFFRQGLDKSLVLSVRHQNYTDKLMPQLKLALAFIVSRVFPLKRPILLYEKNGKKYEESGKVVFQALIDRGYKNAFFVLSKQALRSVDINEEYLPYLLYQHTFKQYLYFFRSRTFIGTEGVGHAIEVRLQNPIGKWHSRNKKNAFVFLQHGPSYMVSLNSPERSSFVRNAFPKTARVVVSSKKEAEHFMELAGFVADELIISGMPKYDFNFMNDNADKILIMPTWRPWEFAAMRTQPESTGYAALIRRIEAAIPLDLREKTVTLVHPLFHSSLFAGSSDEKSESLDELLRDVSLLITDYSSIAFDAFYRGAKVIFFWEELEDCMKQYGEPTHLMLNTENAFGAVCMNEHELGNCISEIYQNPQEEEDIRKYRHIIEFHDGQNTQRLIDSLEAAGIIRK